MRYVRTRDGKIYEIIGSERTPYGDFITSKKEHIKFDWVLREAKTIEDLCDFIAIVSEKQIYDVEPNIRAHFRYEYEKVLPEAKSEYPDEYWNMYLGTLTDKGLIYAAKMNEDGVLELL